MKKKCHNKAVKKHKPVYFAKMFLLKLREYSIILCFSKIIKSQTYLIKINYKVTIILINCNFLDSFSDKSNTLQQVTYSFQKLHEKGTFICISLPKPLWRYPTVTWPHFQKHLLSSFNYSQLFRFSQSDDSYHETALIVLNEWSRDNWQI